MSSCRGFRLFPARRPFGECRPALFKDLGGGIANVKKIVLALLDHFESYLCQFLLVFFCRRHSASRFVLREIYMSLPWTEEIARFAFIWFILFGALLRDAPVRPEPRATPPVLQCAQWVGNLFLFIGGHRSGSAFRSSWRGKAISPSSTSWSSRTQSPALGLGFGHGLPCLPLELPADGHPASFRCNVIKYILKEEILDPDRGIDPKKAKRRSWQKETRQSMEALSPRTSAFCCSAISFVLLLIGSPINGRPRRCDHGLRHRARH